MSFEIDIKGLDELEKTIKDMQRGLQPDELDFWCKRILNDIKLHGGSDLVETVILEVLKTEEGFEFNISIPEVSLDLTISTIRNFLKEMPFTTRIVFEELIKVIMNKSE